MSNRPLKFCGIIAAMLSSGVHLSAQTQGLTFTSVSVGNGHACAIETSGALYCWGRNDFQQLGFAGPDNPTPRAARTDLATTWLSVSAGFFHTCAVRRDHRVFCWGHNGYGQLGTGTVSTTGELPPGSVTGTLSFLRVSAGSGSTCGIERAPGYIVIAQEPVIGKVYCWGANGDGQLGNGLTSNYLAPTAVSGTATYTTLSLGDIHACAIVAGTKGTARCWGRGANGQIGDGTANPSNIPKALLEGPTAAVPTPRFRTIESGATFSCGLGLEAGSTDAALYCWGKTWFEPQTNFPVPAVTSLRFIAITAGAQHTCGITAANTAYCWGINGSGRLGTGSTSNTIEAPAPVAGSYRFKMLSAGAEQTCGITMSGLLMCWGSNSRGALGTGSSATESRVPVKVAGQP